MHRSPAYERLLKSGKWRRLRAEKLSRQPLCENCEKEGRTRLAQEVHHIVPVETETNEDRMRTLAYDKSNLMSLCSECHHAIHEQAGRTGSASKAVNRARGKKAAEDFAKEWLTRG